MHSCDEGKNTPTHISCGECGQKATLEDWEETQEYNKIYCRLKDSMVSALENPSKADDEINEYIQDLLDFLNKGLDYTQIGGDERVKICSTCYSFSTRGCHDEKWSYDRQIFGNEENEPDEPVIKYADMNKTSSLPLELMKAIVEEYNKKYVKKYNLVYPKTS